MYHFVAKNIDLFFFFFSSQNTFFSYGIIINKGTEVEKLKENEYADDVIMAESNDEGYAREMFGTSYRSSEDDDFLKII